MPLVCRPQALISWNGEDVRRQACPGPGLPCALSRHDEPKLTNFATMASAASINLQRYNGAPLPEGVESVAWPAILGVVISFALIVLLRARFDREWQLTVWSWGDIRRVWKRLPNESARSGGVLISHMIGWSAWGMAGATWWHAAPLMGFGRGLLMGAAAFGLRALSTAFGRWLTGESEVFENSAELDRHLRSGLAALFALGILGLAIREPHAQGWAASAHNLLWIWAGWLVIKWFRGLQLMFHRRIAIGWGIAYLCTLEITPTIVLAMKGLGEW